MEYPGIWSNIILCVSVRVLPHEASIWMVHWVKQTALLSVGSHYPVHWGCEGTKSWRKWELTPLPDCWAKTSVFCPWTGTYHHQHFGFRLEFISPAFLGHQLGTSQAVGLLSPHNHMSQFLTINPLCIYNTLCIYKKIWIEKIYNSMYRDIDINISICQYLYISYWFCFFEEPWLQQVFNNYL